MTTQQSRKQSREFAFYLIFELQFRPDESADEIFALAQETRAFKLNPYIKTTFEGVFANLTSIDALIDKHSIAWKSTRISKVSLALLRLAIYEMRHSPDIPQEVAINEAIELAKRYDTDDGPKYINAVLDAIKSELGPLEKDKIKTDEKKEAES